MTGCFWCQQGAPWWYGGTTHHAVGCPPFRIQCTQPAAPAVPERKRAERCAHWWERRSKGKRYVNARGQCKRTTAHPSGYCSEHRPPVRSA